MRELVTWLSLKKTQIVNLGDGQIVFKMENISYTTYHYKKVQIELHVITLFFLFIIFTYLG
jgi:hypothetical protein